MFADDAAAAGPHDGDRPAGDLDEAEDIGLEDGAPVLHGHGFDRQVGGLGSGVVDQDAQAVGEGDALGDGDIETAHGDGAGSPGHLVGQAGAVGRVPHGGDNVEAGARQLDGDGPPESSTGAGDDGDSFSLHDSPLPSRPAPSCQETSPCAATARGPGVTAGARPGSVARRRFRPEPGRHRIRWPPRCDDRDGAGGRPGPSGRGDSSRGRGCP
jgi:hypothetical protein